MPEASRGHDQAQRLRPVGSREDPAGHVAANGVYDPG
jgi:hypothetical protein